jgi:hypothetical protein
MFHTHRPTTFVAAAIAALSFATLAVPAAQAASHKRRPSISMRLNPTTMQSGDQIGIDVRVVAPNPEAGIFIYRSADGSCQRTYETASNNSASGWFLNSVQYALNGATRGAWHFSQSAPSVTAPNVFTICALLYSETSKKAYAKTAVKITVNPDVD